MEFPKSFQYSFLMRDAHGLNLVDPNICTLDSPVVDPIPPNSNQVTESLLAQAPQPEMRAPEDTNEPLDVDIGAQQHVSPASSVSSLSSLKMSARKQQRYHRRFNQGSEPISPEERRTRERSVANYAKKYACCECVAENFCACGQRFISHSWFFFLCCGYVILSSLPRIFVLVDFLLSFSLYLISVSASLGKFDPGNAKLWRAVWHDIAHFRFSSSGVDILVVAVVRVVLLYSYFGYRYQASPTSVKISLTTSAVSIAVCIIKAWFSEVQEIRTLCYVTITMVLLEIMTFLIVRRRRILLPSDSLFQDTSVYHPISSEDDEESPTNDDIVLLNESVHPLVDSTEDLRFPESAFKYVNGVRVHYVWHENPDSDVVLVFFHGFGGGCFSFRQIWSQLCHGSESVLVFDRPGFGLTSRQMSEKNLEPYTTRFSVEIARSLLRDLKASRCILIGHSTGSGAAIQAALDLDDEFSVDGLVLVSPSDGLPEFIRSIVKTSLGRQVIIQLVRSELGSVALQRAWYDPTSVPSEVIDRYRSALQVPSWSDSLWEMTQVKTSPNSELAAMLSFELPVLILNGEDDRLVSSAEKELLIESFPQAQVVDLEECGHLPHEESPDAFLEVLGEFISFVRNHVAFASDTMSSGNEQDAADNDDEDN